MMFDNKTRKPTTQGTVFFVKEGHDTEMTQAEIEGFWKGKLEGCDLEKVSKYGSNWDIDGDRERDSMGVSGLNPKEVMPILANSCQALLEALRIRDTKGSSSLREQEDTARTSKFFEQHTGGSVPETIKAFSAWQANYPISEI